MTVVNLSLYSSWKCPCCFWTARFWLRPFPEEWADIPVDTRRKIADHAITHEDWPDLSLHEIDVNVELWWH